MLKLSAKINNFCRSLLRKNESDKLLDYQKIFNSVLVFRLCGLIMIYFTLEFRKDIPMWMYLVFKNISYPLFFINGLLLLILIKIHC